MAAWSGWQRDVLAKLGAADTLANERFLSDWHGYEQSTCAFNPLNTTLRVAGSVSCNMVGVQSYASSASGATATADTIKNGFYPALLAALRSGDPYSYADPQGVAANITKWGTPNFAAAYLLAAGSFAGTGGTPPKPAATPTATPESASGHRGWADLRNTVNRHLPTQVARSDLLVRSTLRRLHARSRVKR